MPSTCSEDEFDALPDLFGNIDWDSANIAGLESVPPVPPQSSPPMPSSSQPTVQPTRTSSSATLMPEVDHITNLCPHVDVEMNCGDAVNDSVHETPEVGEEVVGEGGRAATPSSSYSYSFDSIDDDFLKEVDAFEAGVRAERVVEHEGTCIQPETREWLYDQRVELNLAATVQQEHQVQEVMQLMVVLHQRLAQA